MIIVKAIDISGVLHPESVPENSVGNHCDGDNFYFFQTKDEMETKLNEIYGIYVEYREQDAP